MMTFLVCSNFVENAKLLSARHLAKQRVEATQILNIIEQVKQGGTPAWHNHPIVKSWFDYTDALKYYITCIISEFIFRGGNNNMEIPFLPRIIRRPWWVTWDRLHYSHQAMLNRKDPRNYKFEAPEEYYNYGYIWPCDIDLFQVDDDLATITAEIPKDLVNPRYCPAVIKSGKRKGQPCYNLLKGKANYCGVHNK